MFNFYWNNNIDYRKKTLLKSSLYLVPFLGIFWAFEDLLFGPTAGYQYYLTFSTSFLLVVICGIVIYSDKKIEVTVVDVAWALFLIYLTINFWSNNTGFPFFKYQQISIAAGLYVVFRTEAKYVIDEKNLIVPGFFALLSFGICGYAFLQYFEFLPSRSVYFSFTSFFANPAPLAIFLSGLCPYFFVILYEKGKITFVEGLNVRKIIFFLGLLFSVVIIYLSYSRTAWVALTAMGVVYYILFYREQSVKLQKVRGWALVFLVFIGLLYYIKPESAKGRILNYLVSFELWKQTPFFGVGWNDFSYFYNQLQVSYFEYYPASIFRYVADDLGVYYNEFIRMAVELGIVGLVLFVGTLFVSLRYSRLTLIKSPVIVKAAWLSTVGILVVGLFSYPLSQVYTMVLFVFNIAVLAYFENRVYSTIQGVKLKFMACGIVLGAMVLIYHECTVLRASVKWQKAYDTITHNQDQGLRIYDKIYPSLKSYPTFLYNYGYELSMAEKNSKSLKILQKAQRNMFNLDLLLRKGYVQKQLNNYKKAEKNYKQAHYLIPSRLVPYYLLMRLYEDWPKPQKAKKIAEKILDMNSKVESEKALFIKNKTKMYLDNNSSN